MAGAFLCVKLFTGSPSRGITFPGCRRRGATKCREAKLLMGLKSKPFAKLILIGECIAIAAHSFDPSASVHIEPRHGSHVVKIRGVTIPTSGFYFFVSSS
jgi:hypothetical protein